MLKGVPTEIAVHFYSVVAQSSHLHLHLSYQLLGAWGTQVQGIVIPVGGAHDNLVPELVSKHVQGLDLPHNC